MFTASSPFFIMKLHLNLSLRQALLAAMAAVAALAPTVSAGIVDTRYDLQYYLDFSRNAGAFSAGATNVTVGYRDGSATYTIPVMPYVGSYAQAVDRSFAAVGAIVSYGGSSLVSSQFMYGAAHVFDRFSNIFAKGQMGFSFNDENGNAYSGDIYGAVNVDRFGHDGAISRTDKLVTAVAYTPMASDKFMSTLDSSTWLYRLGNGGYWNTNAAIISTGSNAIGGIIDMDSYSRQTNGDWHMKGIFRDDQSTPLDTGVYEGDSGSPLYAWDEGNNRFVYVGALWASNLHKGFGNDVYARYNPTLAQAAMAQYTINATFSGADTIAWSASDAATGKGTLTQGDDIINYIGKGSENTMGATKGISFATDSDRQQVLQLQGNVNMGAGALTFTKGDWKITEAADYTLSSAGFEVLMGASLTWELTGTSSEEIRKVGEGTLIIAGSGRNEASLVVGGGTVVYEPEYDAENKLVGYNLANVGETRLNRQDGYAAGSVRLEGGVASIVLMGDNQFKTKTVAGDTFTFGNDGGLLNLNGHNLEWGVIQQDGSGKGARIGNFTPLDCGTPQDATFTFTGSGTFDGCFVDESNASGDGKAQLAVVYNGGANGAWKLSGNNTNVGGFTVQSGTLKLEGINTHHVWKSDANDWVFASIDGSDVTVKKGATFQLSHHAQLVGNVVVEDGGSFIMNQVVNASKESISGSSRIDMAGREFVSLKGDVQLNGASTMLADISSPATTIIQGNITGNTSTTFEKSGSGILVVDGKMNVPMGTVSGGGLVVKNSTGFLTQRTSWLIEEAGFLAVEGLDNEKTLSCVKSGSSGVLALTSNQATELKLKDEYFDWSNLYIGAWGENAVQYGDAQNKDATLSAYDGAWRLGGGTGTLTVNFKLCGEDEQGNVVTDLIVGNDYSSGTVHLTNEGNKIRDIYIKGTGNRLSYDSVEALGGAMVSLSYGNALALYDVAQIDIINTASSGVLALSSDFDGVAGTELNLAGRTLSVGALGSMTFSGTVLLGSDEPYRFGGYGDLSLDSGNLDSGKTVYIDGQGSTGSSVTLVNENAFTGEVVVGGGIELESPNSKGDIALHVTNSMALAGADSVNLQKGANFHTDGQNLMIRNLNASTDSRILNTGESASTLVLQIDKDSSIADGVLNDSYNYAGLHLVKAGSGTLSMGYNNSWSGGLSIAEGTVEVRTYASGNQSLGGVGTNGGSIYVDEGATLRVKSSSVSAKNLYGTILIQNVTGNGTIEVSTGGSSLLTKQATAFDGTVHVVDHTRLYIGENMYINQNKDMASNLAALNSATIRIQAGSQARVTSTVLFLSTDKIDSWSDYEIAGNGYTGNKNYDLCVDYMNEGALSVDLGSTVWGSVKLMDDASISSYSQNVKDSTSFPLVGGGSYPYQTIITSSTGNAYGVTGALGGTIRGQIKGTGKETLSIKGNEGITITADSKNSFGDLVIASSTIINGTNRGGFHDGFALRLDGGKAVSQISTALGLGEVTINDGLVLRLAGTGAANQTGVEYTYANTIKAGNGSTIESYNITNKLAGVVCMAEGSDKTLNLTTANGGVLHLAGGVSGTGTLNIGASSKVILGDGTTSSMTFRGNVVTGAGAELTLESAASLSTGSTITGTDSLTLRLGGTSDYTLGGITMGGEASSLALHFDFTQEGSAEYSTLHSTVSAATTTITIDLNMFNDIIEGNYTLISGNPGNSNYTLADTCGGRLSLAIDGGTVTLQVGADNRLYWAADSASQEWNDADQNWRTGNKGEKTAYSGTTEVMLTSSGLSTAGTRESISVSNASNAGIVNVSSLYEIVGEGSISGTQLRVGDGGDLLLHVHNAGFSDGVLVNNATLTVEDMALTADIKAENGAAVNLNNATLTGNMTLGASAAVNMDAARITGSVSSAISSPVVLKDAALSGTFSTDVAASVLMADNMVLSAGSFEVVSQMQAGSITVDGGSFSIKGAAEIENLAVSSGQSAKLYNADKTVGNNKKIGTLALADSASLVIENTTEGTSASGVIDTLQLAGTATIKEVRDSGYLKIGSLSLADGITTGTLQLSKANTNRDNAYTSVIEFGSASAPAGNFAGDIVMSNTKPSGSSDNHSLFVTVAGKEIFSNAAVKMQTQECSGGYLGLGIMADGAIIGGLESSSSLGTRALLFSGESLPDKGWNTGDKEDHKLQNGNTVRTLVIDADAGTDYAFNGRVFNNLNIVKKGEGSQAFNGVSTGYNSSYNFNGAIELQEGTLIFGKDALSMLTNASSVTISGGTLDISSYDFNAANAGLELNNFTFSENAVLALGDLKQGTVYEFFGSSVLSLTNWTDLTTDNFSINGVSLSDMGRVNLVLNMGGSFSYTIEDRLNLVWNGGASGTWEKNGSADSWTGSGETGQSSFANYDSVSFNSSASLTVAERVIVNNLTVAQGAELTTEGGLTIQGDLSVAAGAKWTLAGDTEQSLTRAQLEGVSSMVIGADATLKISDKLTSGYTKQNLSGTGKVELDLSQGWSNKVQLGAGFNGEAYITSGYFDISGVQVGSTLRLADGVYANSDSAKTTVTANLILEGESVIHANDTKSITYSGSVTGQNGVYVSNGADSHIFNGEVNLKGFRVAHASSSTYFNGKTTLETLNISTGRKTEFNGETNITTATFSGGTTLFNGVTTIGTANISTNMVFSSEMNIGTANISQNTTEFKAETSLNELKVTGGTVKIAGLTTIANGITHTGGDIIFYADTAISGRVNDSGGNFRLLEGEVKLSYAGKDGNTIKTLDASDGGASKGTVRLGRDVKVSATNVYGTGNSKYILEQGASLTHENKTVISNTGTGEATITSSASDGQIYGLGNGKFELTNAHLKYTAGGNVTVNNKLTNTSVESAGGGTLTVSGTGNQLAGLYATGGNLKVEGLAGVSLGTISISTDRMITSTVIEVSDLARFEQGATLAADLTLLNGAKLDLTGEAVLNGALTLQTGLKMGDALLAMVSGMEVGDSVTLFSGVTGLTLQSGVTMFNMRSLEETLSSESFLSDTQANAADYFSNISSNSGLVISFSAVDGTVSISQSIPEPTTSTLGLLALAGLCARRRRK